MWDGIVMIKAAYAERPRIPLFNGVLSRWTNLSAMRLKTPRTGAILDGRRLHPADAQACLAGSGASTFCSGWDLENEVLK